MEFIEVSAKTVSEAITEACQKLGVTSDRLEYEVLDEGSAGFLGFGAKLAKIKACVKLSVEDNIKLVLQMNDKLTEDEKKQKLEDLLQEFGMEKKRKFSAISLSGGERRRVELARALAASPEFILLDEPFTGIDPIAIGEIKDNIRKLSEEKGLGVLITDHNPKATLSITDRAYVIFDGKIKIQGKSVEVANDPVAKQFYLGKDFTL